MNEAALRPVPVEGGVIERKWKAVYTIVERTNDSGKKFWLRVGSAFVNRDQSINVRLDAIPTNGMLHIRDYEPPADRRPGDYGNHNPSYRNPEGGF